MKNLVVGLPPDYYYPGTLDLWKNDNTTYAANLGACLITNALMKEFSADYVDDFSDLSVVRRRYDRCIVSLATHAHPRRDISALVRRIEQLDLPPYVLSLGITDFDSAITRDYSLHPSIVRLLDIASSASKWIGVRGHHTAFVLNRAGYSNVLPTGCPSLFWSLRSETHVVKPEHLRDPLVAYHSALAQHVPGLIEGLPLLGQDFQDQAAFTDSLSDDGRLHDLLDRVYRRDSDPRVILSIRERAHFLQSFQQWFSFIGNHGFVLGGRLHGTIAALIQGVPAVLLSRDLRMNELGELFQMPMRSLASLKNTTLDDLYDSLDFAAFSETYALRYSNFYAMVTENGLSHNLESPRYSEFRQTAYDTSVARFITSTFVLDLEDRVRRLESRSIAGRFTGFLHGLGSLSIRALRKAKRIGRQLFGRSGT